MKSHARAPGQTHITISLPETLKDDITVFAKEENRTRSNWIVHELIGLVTHKKAEKASKLLRVAEEDPPDTMVIDRRALGAARKKKASSSIYRAKKRKANNPHQSVPSL